MYVHLTNTQVIIGSFALILIITFALAAFLDKRWRTALPHRHFDSNQKLDSIRQSSSRDDKVGPSNLYTRYADLSARGLAPLSNVLLSEARNSRISQGIDNDLRDGRFFS